GGTRTAENLEGQKRGPHCVVVHHVEAALLDNCRKPLLLGPQRDADLVGGSPEADLAGAAQPHNLRSAGPGDGLAHQRGQNRHLMPHFHERGSQVANMRLDPSGAVHIVGADLGYLHGIGGGMSRKLGIPLTLYETVAYTATSVGRITRTWLAGRRRLGGRSLILGGVLVPDFSPPTDVRRHAFCDPRPQSEF